MMPMLEVVAVNDNDPIAHVLVWRESLTLCGMYATVYSTAHGSGGGVRFGRPSDYANLCGVCRDKVVTP